MNNTEYKLETKGLNKGCFLLKKRSAYCGISTTSCYKTPWEDMEYFTTTEVKIFTRMVYKEVSKAEIEERIRLKAIGIDDLVRAKEGKLKRLDAVLSASLASEYLELEKLKRELYA